MDRIGSTGSGGSPGSAVSMCSEAYPSPGSLLFYYCFRHLLPGLRRNEGIVRTAARTDFEGALVSSLYSVFCSDLSGIPADPGIAQTGHKTDPGLEIPLLVSVGGDRDYCLELGG